MNWLKKLTIMCCVLLLSCIGVSAIPSNVFDYASNCSSTIRMTFPDTNMVSNTYYFPYLEDTSSDCNDYGNNCFLDYVHAYLDTNITQPDLSGYFQVGNADGYFQKEFDVNGGNPTIPGLLLLKDYRNYYTNITLTNSPTRNDCQISFWIGTKKKIPAPILHCPPGWWPMNKCVKMLPFP